MTVFPPFTLASERCVRAAVRHLHFVCRVTCSPVFTSQARKLATRTKTITGCLQKGYEPDESSIIDEDGDVWGLRSSAVKLDGHLGHRVTVGGPNTHESTAERTLGNKEFGDLRVASLKTVSGTCDK